MIFKHICSYYSSLETLQISDGLVIADMIPSFSGNNVSNLYFYISNCLKHYNYVWNIFDWWGTSHVQFTVNEQPSSIIWHTILQMFLASSMPECGCPMNFSPRCSSIFPMLNLGKWYNLENNFLMSIHARAYAGSVTLVRTHWGYKHDLMSHGLYVNNNNQSLTWIMHVYML